MSDPLASLDATAQAELVRRGEASPAELVDAAIARIERVNPTLNAVIHPLFEKARAAARDPALPSGPFRGVPFLVKDAVCTTAGDPYHLGMRFLKRHGYRAPRDSELARRFRAAGFVFVGKTNTPELALSVTTEPLAYGATRNPWNLAHSTGGSSGGSAAAVAAGLAPVGHANDMGGSIRIPARPLRPGRPQALARARHARARLRRVLGPADARARRDAQRARQRRGARRDRGAGRGRSVHGARAGAPLRARARRAAGRAPHRLHRGGAFDRGRRRESPRRRGDGEALGRARPSRCACEHRRARSPGARAVGRARGGARSRALVGAPRRADRPRGRRAAQLALRRARSRDLGGRVRAPRGSHAGLGARDERALRARLRRAPDAHGGGAAAAPRLARSGRSAREAPAAHGRLHQLHHAVQCHRPAGDLAAARLESRRASDRRAARRELRPRGPADPPGVASSRRRGRGGSGDLPSTRERALGAREGP